jgi:hypothetical protein
MKIPRFCSVSVDLDGLRFYEQIHGVAPSNSRCPVYSTAVDRLGTWARSLSIPLTWFVVGRDARSDEVASRLRERFLAGDELGNHTEHHHYDLTHRPYAEQEQEVTLNERRLCDITGQRRFGFRAPGYRIARDLVDILSANRALYDSSLFPCPPYYAAKALILLKHRLTGQRSRAVLDRPEVLAAPRTPHRLDGCLRPADHGLLELPISVTPGLNLPFIGTTLTLVGIGGVKLLSFSMRNQAFVNLELHGIDALDARDGLEHLLSVQPGLRTPSDAKLRALTIAVTALRDFGFRFVTLRDMAASLGE